MKRTAALAACLTLAAVSTATAEWPSFRGEQASGSVSAAALPIEWNLEEGHNVRWSTSIPGLAHSSPVIWGERVFVTTAVSEKEPAFRAGLYGDVDTVEDGSQSWRVYALDRRTGKIVWEHVAHEGVPETKRHLKASHANSTPVTDGKRLVALFASEGLYGYSLDGKLLWKADLGRLDSGWFFNPSYEWGHGSSPIIWKNLVIVQADIQDDPFIAAYDLGSGKEVWKTAREEIPGWGSPTLVDGPKGVELVTNGSRFLRGYDPKTGKELWRLANRSEVAVATPVTAHGLVFFSNGYRPVQSIHAVKIGSRGDISLGDGETSSDHVAWYKNRGGTYMPTPIAYGDHFYTLANGGILTCYEATTGKQIYRERIGGTGGAFTASPVAAGGHLYLASEDGEVHVVKAGPQYALVASNPMGEVMMATPAVASDLLVVRTRTGVHGIGVAPAAEGSGGGH